MRNLEKKPFALIGVNVNERDSKNLREVMEKEQLNWRSFAYQETVNVKWNVSTPAYYVIDHRGVIRLKWFGPHGEKLIDAALDRLIEEAEAGGQDASR